MAPGRGLTRWVGEGRFALLGMVHLEPLPGSPRWGGTMTAVVEAARRDARILRDAGFAGVIVENFGDAPFEPGALPPDTVAALTVCAGAVAEELAGAGMLLGVNALRNDAAAALGIAVAVGADLIRVNVHAGAMWTDQGLITGRAHDTLRRRRLLGAEVAILADVLVKHAEPPAPVDPAAAARELVGRALADGLVVTGRATGSAVDFARLEAVAAAVPGTPVLVGSGVNAESLTQLVGCAGGAIVGTWLKVGGDVTAPVDPERARALVAARDQLRG